MRMKKYDVFLFDADDTLYDYTPSAVYALKTMFERYGIHYTAGIQARYNEINSQTWASYEQGEISGDELQRVRFERLFDEMGVTHDVDDFNTRYLYELGKGLFLVEGALEICREIVSHNKQIYIITNGLIATQEARAIHSPLNQYMSGIFVSQAIGHQKPSKEYFDHVAAHIPGAKDKMLIIGDSLTSDIAGGNNAGIDTCWLNINKTVNPTNIKPTYEINYLLQLKPFI